MKKVFNFLLFLTNLNNGSLYFNFFLTSFGSYLCNPFLVHAVETRGSCRGFRIVLHEINKSLDSSLILKTCLAVLIDVASGFFALEPWLLLPLIFPVCFQKKCFEAVEL